MARSWGSKSCSRLGWRSFFEKSTFSKKSGVKTRLGTILGRFGSPKGVVLGGLWGSSWGREGEGEAKAKAKARPRRGEGEGQAKARRRQGEGQAKGGGGTDSRDVTLGRGW